ncbi:MAG: reverse transcriptase-like protein [Spirochaetes bacterium]|jgi:ribonuclease HI|nr:reverse transcriptase-like protein [Spirochaetota bacterium]
MIKIYTDGSFIDGRCGYGAVITNSGKEIVDRLSGSVTDEKYLKHRQVAGEVMAVLKAIQWCTSNSIIKCEICFDYQGVQSWATGEWKRNTELTSNYYNEMQRTAVKVRWTKVKAHSGDMMNEEADRLAKNGCGAKADDGVIYDTETIPVTKSPGKDDTEALVAEAEQTAIDFATFLQCEGIDGLYGGVFNNMYARVEIGSGKNRSGIVDIYNTKKKRLKPDFRGFNDPVGKSVVQRLWETFGFK